MLSDSSRALTTWFPQVFQTQNGRVECYLTINRKIVLRASETTALIISMTYTFAGQQPIRAKTHAVDAMLPFCSNQFERETEVTWLFILILSRWNLPSIFHTLVFWRILHHGSFGLHLRW